MDNSTPTSDQTDIPDTSDYDMSTSETSEKPEEYTTNHFDKETENTTLTADETINPININSLTTENGEITGNSDQDTIPQQTTTESDSRLFKKNKKRGKSLDR